MPAPVSVSAARPVQSKTSHGAPPAFVSVFWGDALLQCASLQLQVLSTTDAAITLLPQNIIHLFLRKNQLMCLVTSAVLFTSHPEIARSLARSSQHEALCPHLPCASFCAFRQREQSRLHLPSAAVGVCQTRQDPIALCYQEEQRFV